MVSKRFGKICGSEKASGRLIPELMKLKEAVSKMPAGRNITENEQPKLYS